jgi:PPOX class probable F420-dependent enzyme
MLYASQPKIRASSLILPDLGAGIWGPGSGDTGILRRGILGRMRRPIRLSGVTIQLSDSARRLLQAPVFTILSTVGPSGAPQSSVIWVRLDGDDVLFSTIRGRLKTRNMERNPKVSLCAYDPADPYSYVEVRGTVSLTEEGGVELIDELSQAYDGVPWTARPTETRVVVRVTPTKVIDHISPQSAKEAETPQS